MSKDAKDQEQAVKAFRALIAMLESESFDYAIGGGIVTGYWTGGAGRIGDIDVIVREEDTPKIFSRLAEDGYRKVEMEHSWLHKAIKDAITIDLMFELKNGTRFDEQFTKHRAKGELFGTVAWVMAAEDQVASLAATVDRQTIEQHWYSIVDIMSNNDLDWDYVIERARDIPIRMLSVIYFALSEQVPVEKGVIDRLQGLVDSFEP